jgi:hypothetical protein
VNGSGSVVPQSFIGHYGGGIVIRQCSFTSVSLSSVSLISFLGLISLSLFFLFSFPFSFFLCVCVRVICLFFRSYLLPSFPLTPIRGVLNLPEGSVDPLDLSLSFICLKTLQFIMAGVEGGREKWEGGREERGLFCGSVLAIAY